MVKVKRLPLPGSLSSQMLPPCSWTSRRVMGRPAPCLPASRCPRPYPPMKRFEDRDVLFGRDADAGVRDRDLRHPSTARAWIRMRPPLGANLTGITHQIKGSGHAQLIGIDEKRDRRPEFRSQSIFETLGGGWKRGLRQQSFEIEVLPDQLQFARLDSRRFENVVQSARTGAGA